MFEVRERPEAADEEPGGDDQQDSEGDFSDGEGAAESVGHGGESAAGDGVERAGGVFAGGLKRRRSAKEQAGDDCKNSRESEDAQVDVRVGEARRVRWQGNFEQMQAF